MTHGGVRVAALRRESPEGALAGARAAAWAAHAGGA